MGKTYELTTESLSVLNNNLYFVPRECPIVCRWDFQSDIFEVVSDVPEENPLIDRLFNGACILDNKMVLAPYNAKKIWIYDIESGNWNSLDLDGICDGELKGKYVGCKSYEQFVYFFGYEASNVLRINLLGSLKEIPIKNRESKGGFWGQSVATVNEKIMIPNLNERGICQINSGDESVELITLNDVMTENCGIAYNNNVLFIVPYKGNQLMAVYENGISKIIKLPNSLSGNVNYFNGIAASVNALILFSPLGKSLFIRDIANSCVYEDNGFISYAIYDETIGFVVSKKGCIEIYDDNLILKKKISTVIDGEKYLNLIRKNGLKGGLYQENIYFGLKEMLEVIE